MLKISKEQARKRWDTLPDALKEALFSETNTDAVWQISKKSHIPEDKISVVALTVGDVILGFLSTEELTKELGENLNIDIRIASEIAQEIERKIFFPIRNQIRENYNPTLPSIEEEIPIASEMGLSDGQKIIPLEKIDGEKIISIKEDPSEVKLKEEKPLIIHEEKISGAEETEIQKRQKIFSSPFRFFQSKQNQTEEKPAVKVRIETSKDTTRVVHYSEFRTPVAPLAGKEEFISLDKFEKETVAEAPIALTPEQIKPTLQAKTFFSWPLKPATQPQKSREENKLNNQPPNQPKLDGNLIDLR